jgi:serine/threonine-protein kinase
VQQINAAGLHPKVNNGPNDNVAKGKVFKQDPGAGQKVDKGGTVAIWVSTGPPKVTVPAVKGQQWTTAQQTLVNEGLQPVEHIVPGNTKGQVTATDPPAGQRVPKNSKVRVNVMSGPATASVPNVVGMNIADAQTALHNAGFNGNPSYVNSDAPQGQVISQSPAPTTSETKGTTVNLKVSTGPPQVTVPDVVGYTSQQAVSTLEAAGFLVTQQTTATDASQQNIVQQQNPAGNARALKGSTVTIVVGQHSPGPPPPPPTTTTTGEG